MRIAASLCLAPVLMFGAPLAGPLAGTPAHAAPTPAPDIPGLEGVTDVGVSQNLACALTREGRDSS